MDEHREDVVVFDRVEHLASCLLAGAYEIAHDDDQVVVAGQAPGAVERLVEHRRIRDTDGLGPQFTVPPGDHAEDLQHAASAAMRGNPPNLGIIEYNGADTVPDMKDAPRQERGDVSRDHRLHVQAGAEKHRDALVDDEDSRRSRSSV